MGIVKDIITSKDGESYNFAKVWGIIIILLFLAASLWGYIFMKYAFDPSTWGGVLTAIYGTVNGAIRATHVTEPDA